MKTKITALLPSLILILIQLCSTDVKSQNIGVNGTGGNPHPSALLDVDASATPSLGILIPRIALQAINLAAPVSSPATSLLVYNTASASTGTNAVSAGYYYWDGIKWVRFAYSASGSSANDWNILGNISTNSSTNFLGTTDNQDLTFRTNNVEKMRIMSGGNVGIGTTTPGYKLHVPSGYIGTDYINTTDNAVASGVTGIIIKAGDNFHRTGNAASVLSFLGVTAPTGDNLGNHIATTTLNMNNNYIDNAQGSSRFAQSNNTSTSYNDAPIQLRESQYSGGGSAIPPRLAFHWAGVVASQIGIESNGRISILNNPGTSYENFVSNETYSNQWFRNINSGTGLYNETNGTGIFSPSIGVMSIYNNGKLGVGTTAPAEILTIENGNVQVGELLPATGIGRKLHFSSAGNNTDDIYLQRENISLDKSNLQIMLGDNLGGDDNFLIKTSASTTPLLTVVNNGNIGINTLIAPTEKLEVLGSVKIVDGTQGAGRVLTSDAAGKATWGTLGPQTSVGTIPNADLIQTQTSAYQYMGYSIVVPAGRSTVSAGIFTQSSDNSMNYYTCQLSGSSAVTGNTTGFSNLPGLCAVVANHQGTAVGTVVFYVNNTSGAPKTLYLWGYAASFTVGGTLTLRGTSTAAEPYIISAY